MSRVRTRPIQKDSPTNKREEKKKKKKKNAYRVKQTATARQEEER